MRLLELSVEGEPRQNVRKSRSTDALDYIIIVCIRLTFPLRTHMQYTKSMWKVANSVYLTQLPVWYQFTLDPQWKGLGESG